jgi:hypothetical protein
MKEELSSSRIVGDYFFPDFLVVPDHDFIRCTGFYLSHFAPVLGRIASWCCIFLCFDRLSYDLFPIAEASKHYPGSLLLNIEA